MSVTAAMEKPRRPNKSLRLPYQAWDRLKRQAHEETTTAGRLMARLIDAYCDGQDLSQERKVTQRD